MSETRKSRRALLTGLGAVALTSASAIQRRRPAKADSKLFASFTDLQSDTSLKAGAYAETMGYYQPGDGGGACYQITEKVDERFCESLNEGLFACLLAKGYVNYTMFGAVGNGVADDGIAIKNAHCYANKERIPVVNLSGEYWLKDTKKIPIKTNTNWGSTIFHIDESLNKPGEPHFEVLPDESPIDVVLSPEKKKSFLETLRPGCKFIPELAEYRNALIVVKDENDRIGRRYGADYNPRGWAREEFFYVEEHGRIIGDIAWTFSDYTHLTAYPCSKNYLTVEGGTFIVSGDNPGKLGGPYHQSGITTRRSRTIIRNQWVGLEENSEDSSLTPRAGFYTFSYAYDILLENIRLIPWEKIRPQADKTLKAGTYGIGGSRVLCGTFRNVTAEGSPIHWGVFGTNLFKNFRIEQCRLNRVDVHFHGWNIAIIDSEIGQKGLTLTGGGELLVENTRVFNNYFVNFRQDYGSRWDGPIRIVNCQAVLQTPSNATILAMRPGVFDYKYPVVLGSQIVVRDFVFNSSPNWEAAKYSLIHFPPFANSQEGGRLQFPEKIAFSNIRVDGRIRGVCIFELADVSGFYVNNRHGGLQNEVVETNCFIDLENIVLDNDPASPNFRVNITQPYRDSHAVYPSITVSNCRHLRAELGDILASIHVRDTLVELFSAGITSYHGRIAFDNCRFRASLAASEKGKLFQIKADSGVSFTNCEINVPLRDNVLSSSDISSLAFLTINGPLRHNHLNTRLGADFFSYLTSQRIQLKRAFIEKLKNHHELEE